MLMIAPGMQEKFGERDHTVGTQLDIVPTIMGRLGGEGRAEAVTSAIMQAKENDVVLLAGKGHEDYQIVGNRRLDYSDRVTAARLLGVVA